MFRNFTIKKQASLKTSPSFNGNVTIGEFQTIAKPTIQMT
jgi:hypothetical protein